MRARDDSLFRSGCWVEKMPTPLLRHLTNVEQVVACFHHSYSQGFKDGIHMLISSQCAIHARVSKLCVDVLRLVGLSFTEPWGMQLNHVLSSVFQLSIWKHFATECDFCTEEKGKVRNFSWSVLKETSELKLLFLSLLHNHGMQIW